MEVNTESSESTISTSFLSFSLWNSGKLLRELGEGRVSDLCSSSSLGCTPESLDVGEERLSFGSDEAEDSSDFPRVEDDEEGPGEGSEDALKRLLKPGLFRPQQIRLHRRRRGRTMHTKQRGGGTHGVHICVRGEPPSNRREGGRGGGPSGH